MGNCLRSQEKVVKIMNMDGKIIKWKAPIQVHQVLSEYKGHAVSSTHPALSLSYLRPDTVLVGGYFYYLVPIQTQTPKATEKVRFLSSEVEEAGRESSALRIKLVITKQELRQMIENRAVSIDAELCQFQNKVDEDENKHFGDNYLRGRIWKPALKTIPEIN